MNPCLLKFGGDDKKLNYSSGQVRDVQPYGFGVLSFLLVHWLVFVFMGFGGFEMSSFMCISRP